MKASKIWSFIGSNIISLATVLAGIIVVILDLLKIISSSVTYPVILAILTMLATSEIIEGRGKLSKIEEALEELSNQLTSSMHIIQTTAFTSSEEAADYLTRRTRDANISVEQASLDIFRSGSRKTSSRENYEKERRNLILSDRVKYRYVGTLHDTRRLEENHEYVINRNLKKYFVGFFQKPISNIPLLTFTIFDNQEVFLRPPYDPSKGVVYYVIKSPHAVQLFLGYFDKLWEESDKFETESDYQRFLGNLYTNK